MSCGHTINVKGIFVVLEQQMLPCRECLFQGRPVLFQLNDHTQVFYFIFTNE